MTDAVNHPPHYRGHASGVECIEITEHMTFNLGNAVKYIFRRDDKNNRNEDLKKAIWYLRREAARLRDGEPGGYRTGADEPLARVIAAEPDPLFRAVYQTIYDSYGGIADSLDHATSLLEAALDAYPTHQ